MFSLDRQPAKILIKQGPKLIKQGNDEKRAQDIVFSFSIQNDFLDRFDKNLKTYLFTKEPDDEKDLADKGMPDDYLTALKHPELTSIKWKYKSGGYRLAIISPSSGKEDVILIDCEISDFKFSAEDGGTVLVSFKATGYPNEKEFGRLGVLSKTEVDLTLEPPSAEKKAQMRIDDAKASITPEQQELTA